MCVCVWEGGLESELELGDGRKQQMVQLRTNRCRTCTDQKYMLSDEIKNGKKKKILQNKQKNVMK